MTEGTRTDIPAYTWSTPIITGSPAVIAAKGATYTVAVENPINRNLGGLKIIKAFDPLTSGFTGKFSISYDCNDGTTHDGTAQLGAGEFTTITGIPTGTSCTVSQPTLPNPPIGWTFGTPSISPAQPVNITSTTTTVEVTVTNTISKDLGNFKITKSTSNPDGAALPAAFTGTYNCGTGYTGNWSVADGASQTISGIPTGNSCSVTEVAPTAIPGFTWADPTYTPASIVIGSTTGTFEIVVGNSITRDRGSLKLSKSLIGGPAGYIGPFQINYDCDGTAFDGSKMVTAGSPEIVSGIPTGTSCTISETLPTPPPGYAFATPTFSPSATVTITDKDATVEVTTTNKMGQDLIVTKTAAGTFDRTYLWQISKAVDQTTVNIANGGIATFNYTVVAHRPASPTPAGHSPV